MGITGASTGRLPRNSLSLDRRFSISGKDCEMKEIPLNKGMVALVDDEDYEMVMQYKWYGASSHGNIYARYSHIVNGKIVRFFMHQLILGIINTDIKGDHADHNGLNNRRGNLRKCAQFENAMNRKLNRNNKSGYKGVYSEHPGRWRADIRVNKILIHLGSFGSSVEAAIAYDMAAIKYFGSFALTNAMLGAL